MGRKTSLSWSSNRVQAALNDVSLLILTQLIHDPDNSQRDLVDAIGRGDFPKYAFKIQVMTEEEAKSFRWNPFDLTKVWPHGEYPLIDVGVIELNKIPDNYYQDVEQAAFAPANLVDGIGFSPDKMLQGRILVYPDAHRYGIGANFESLPVNRCPYAVHNYHRDGAMRFDGNSESAPNYRPNSFDNITEDQDYAGTPYELDSNVVVYYGRNENDDDHYSQPGMLFDKVMTAEQQQNTINNTVGAMSGISGPKKDEIINCQLCHWFRASTKLGMGVAEGLGVDVSQFKELV